MKRFIAKLTAITAAIIVVGWLVFSMFLPEYYLPIFPWLLGFFYLVTVGIHAYQLRLAKKDIGKFTRSNMLMTFLKLVLYSVVAVVFIAVDKDNAIPFVICLMLLYLIFTFIEVSDLTRVSRSSKK